MEDMGREGQAIFLAFLRIDSVRSQDHSILILLVG